jgi:hypothetical protein
MSRIKFPSDVFELRPDEKPMYGESTDLRTAVEYFRSLMATGDWTKRREAVAKRFYQSLVGEIEPADKGKYFDERDLFGWYLFLGESFNEHPWNYEVFYGARVVPALASIGASIGLLKEIKGFEEQAKRLVNNNMAQPNGPLFEFLVAAAYARAGGKVVMRPEGGGGKSYDLDVELNGTKWAVECKRLEAGEYAEKERQRMRDLWRTSCGRLIKDERNAILNVEFKQELSAVPDDYLAKKVASFLRGYKSAMLWTDALADGEISNLQIDPIQLHLKDNHVLHPSPLFMRLLTGRHRKADNFLSMLRLKFAANPHFVDDLDLAVVARWDSLSDAAIDKKARDITRRLSEANTQLPTDTRGIVHIGFDCLSGDRLEPRRFEKIVETVAQFERGNSNLSVVYCHYFAPDPTPEEVWAIDETVQWISLAPGERPLEAGAVLIPGQHQRTGVHWDKAVASN